MKIGTKMKEDGIMKKSLYIAASLLVLAACSHETDIEVPVSDMSFIASTETSADTRTVVEGESHVYWEPGDEIKVFADGKSGKFTTDITVSSATAEFKGTLGKDAWSEGMDLWAVYPYSSDAVFDGETITTTLPSEQVARFGSFGKNMNLSIAHSNSSTLQFYNVGGGIRFRLTKEGIKKVTFEGYDGEVLSGRVKIGIGENGRPMITEVIEPSRIITLLPPSGNDSFPTNIWFYCVAIPGTLTSGYKLEFFRDTEYSRRASEKAVTIKRSIFGNIDKADEGCVFLPIPNTFATPDAVDLGLPSGLKWASFNLGASKPEEYGDYYAWGETEPYYNSLNPLSWKDGKEAGYDWHSYKWCMGWHDWLTKYCTDPLFGYNGFTDGKTVLEPEDDAAYVNLGGNWRMPTDAEWTELMENSTWTWTTQNGISGRLVTASNGNSIFLPAAGCWYGTDLVETGDDGLYWSSSLDMEFTSGAREIEFYSNGVHMVTGGHCYGASVRPVYDEGDTLVLPSEAIDLGLSVKWAPFNVGARRAEQYGNYYAWGETQPKNDYSWSTYRWCNGSKDSLTKYNSDSSYGSVDNKTTLDEDDDVAHVKWGSSWRMPTRAEWEELCNQNDFDWIWTDNYGGIGITGWIVASKIAGYEGNSIFLPAVGHRIDDFLDGAETGGEYWSSTYAKDKPYNAYEVGFNSSDVLLSRGHRCTGRAVRPVCPK